MQSLFARLSGRYDLMNDVMTLGMHRGWKREALRLLGLKDGDNLLDVCCGTGDIAAFMQALAPGVQVTGLDFCEAMLEVGRRRMAAAGILAEFVQGDAMALPFEDNCFDGVVISYGLRNVADYEACMREMFRVVRPGGRIVILDMSHPNPVMNALSGFYRFTAVPLLGRIFANDPDAYRYLSNSIYFYLSQQALCELMQQSGLQDVRFRNKMGGICALHWGVKALS